MNYNFHIASRKPNLNAQIHPADRLSQRAEAPHFHVKFESDSRKVYSTFPITFTIDLAIDQRDPIDRSTRPFAPIEVPACNYFPRTHMSVYLSIAKKREREKIAQSARFARGHIRRLLHRLSFVVDARARVPEINRPRLLPASHAENYDKAVRWGENNRQRVAAGVLLNHSANIRFTSAVNCTNALKFHKTRKKKERQTRGSRVKTISKTILELITRPALLITIPMENTRKCTESVCVTHYRSPEAFVRWRLALLAGLWTSWRLVLEGV